MKTCIPLQVVNSIASKYPDCWEQVDSFIEDKNNGEFQWDNRCYIPIAAGIAISSYGGDVNLDITYDAAIIAATAPWRLYKQIYSFDPDMESLLYEQADDLVIPVEVLNSLPYQCLYIETKRFMDFDGFFVHFESDVNDGRLELRFLLVDATLHTLAIPIHIRSGNTIKDGVVQMMEETKRVAKTMGDVMYHKISKDEELKNEVMYLAASKLMQLVLYICAQNKEISEDAEQAKITRIPKSRELIKDKFREVRKWNCGENTGKIIRGIYNQHNYVHYNVSENAGTGSPKRPHARRGHWHHFWVGSEKNSDRHLELKWIAPTFIHKDEGNEKIVKINEVKRKPDDE